MMEEHKDSWSPGNQIYFSGGSAWGIAPTLQSIRLGKEEDISFDKPSDNPLIANIITMDFNNRGNDKTASRAMLRRSRISRKRF